jgi:uncharacterized protein YccT (UPF0319 family)
LYFAGIVVMPAFLLNKVLIMRLKLGLLATAGLLISGLASAAVTVDLHRDLSALIINGEETGLRINPQSVIKLENGQNQIVVRVSKLIPKQSEFEKYYSYPAVITFTASDAKLTLRPAQVVKTQAQAKAYKMNPLMQLVGQDGDVIETEQGVLMPGNGFMRDYEKELATYNSKHKVLNDSATTTELLGAPESTQAAPGMAQEMVRYWFVEASKKERQQFTEWALANRKSVTGSLEADSRPLQMLSHWYTQTGKGERAKILGWLLEQE